MVFPRNYLTKCGLTANKINRFVRCEWNSGTPQVICNVIEQVWSLVLIETSHAINKFYNFTFSPFPAGVTSFLCCVDLITYKKSDVYHQLLRLKQMDSTTNSTYCVIKVRTLPHNKKFYPRGGFTHAEVLYLPCAREVGSQVKKNTSNEPPHGVLGSRENGIKTTREPEAGWEKV